MNSEESLPAPSIADIAILGKLFEEHQPRLLAMLERRLDPKLAPRVSAEDILNNAFLEARRKWNGFKSQSVLTPYAWLYRIALDCLIEVCRREYRALRSP